MAILSIVTGVIALIIGGWTVRRWIHNYLENKSIIRFRIWLTSIGAGKLSDAPSSKYFDVLAYCETAKADGFLVCSNLGGWVFSRDLFQIILDSVETAGSCTFSFLKSIFMDYLGYSSQEDAPDSDARLLKILEYAQRMQLVFCVKIDPEHSASPCGYGFDAVYFGPSLLKEVESLLNDHGSLTALEYVESTTDSKSPFDVMTQVDIAQAVLERLCKSGKAIKSTENYTEFTSSTVYLSLALFKQLYGNQHFEQPSF